MPFSTRNNVLTRIAQGNGYSTPHVMQIATTAITAAAAASGFYTVQLCFNYIGSTPAGTLTGLQLPPGLTNTLNLVQMFGATRSNTTSLYLCWLYQIGTLNLASTGNQLTHDAATFPITRTQLGAATQPLTLMPVIYLTTATTTTAPILRLRNTTGPAAGYTDQDGNSIIGTIDFTFPAAATAVQSGFILRLETGDSGVRDISQIDVTTAAAAGAATVFGLEIIAPLGNTLASTNITDVMTTLLQMADIAAGSATSGTATTYLAILRTGATPAIATGGLNVYIQAVLNTT